MADKRDYYEVLGVPRDADAGAVKRAYRRAAMECHPDRNPGDRDCEERFKQVSEAYSVLSDPQKREIYDRYGHAGLSGAGVGPPDFGGVEDVFEHFQDVFGDFFGFGRRPGRRRDGPRAGRDVRLAVTLTLHEAAFGVSKTLQVGRPVSCDACRGTGARSGSGPQTCPTCRGRGQVAHSRGAFVLTTTCPDCGGSGARIEEPCPKCDGGGQVLERRSIEVNFPAGIDDGVSVRLAGEGEPGARGGPPGNLLVTVTVERHPRFRREGPDLYVEAAVTFGQAALGATLRIPTLEGETDLEVPAGTQPGDAFRLGGLGVPHLRGRGRGDLIAVVRLEVPRKLTRKQKRLLEQWKRAEASEET
jgi:molecular chaperone DnaJ